MNRSETEVHGMVALSLALSSLPLPPPRFSVHLSILLSIYYLHNRQN